MFIRMPRISRRRRVSQPRVRKEEFSRADVIVSLLWLLVGAALVYALLGSFGDDESADALFPVIFAIMLVLIGQFASWHADRERKKHQDRIESLLAEIRDELKKPREVNHEGTDDDE